MDYKEIQENHYKNKKPYFIKGYISVRYLNVYIKNLPKYNICINVCQKLASARLLDIMCKCKSNYMEGL